MNNKKKLPLNRTPLGVMHWRKEHGQATSAGGTRIKRIMQIGTDLNSGDHNAQRNQRLNSRGNTIVISPNGGRRMRQILRSARIESRGK